MTTTVSFSPEVAVAAVRAYNVGSYRGQSNLEIDRTAYERFRAGLPDDAEGLIEMVRFVGEDYGGAQRRFLPHGYREEAALIVGRLHPVLDRWKCCVVAAPVLSDRTPDLPTIEFLFSAFVGTKRWPVWASKTLHFTRPDSFPILDSHAKRALGLRNLGSTPRDYHRFCGAIRTCLTGNHDALAAAHAVDAGMSPSQLKLLDKILYELGA